MKFVNCASVLAILGGTMVVSAPVSAAELSMSPTSLVASHDVLKIADLKGDMMFGPRSQQQQQQQQQQVVQNLAPIAGIIYTPSSIGFDV